MAAGARHTPLPAGSACTSVYRWLRSRLVADASGAPVLRDRDRSAGRARQGRCKPRDLCSTTGTGWPLPCEETTGLSRQPRTGADQHRCIRDPAERSALRLRRRNRSGTANRANFQLSGYSLSRPNKRKRNERVRLRSRLAGRPAPRVHPTPPSRMHHQRDPGMPRASWVLGAWSSGAHVGSAGGLLVFAQLGRTWLQEHTERPGSRRRPKKVHRISDGFKGS